MSRQTMEVIRSLDEIAGRRDQSLAQMAIAWILRRPEITSVLIGASRVEQIKENCDALKNCVFSDDEIGQIDQLTAQALLPSSLWYRELD